ncbi:hypothetical protein ACOSQ2_015962 [Xanthoceras sorbifolium]
MGTKIEYAIDPLASAIPNGNSFTVHGLYDWQFFQTREELKKIQTRNWLEIDFSYSMDRTLEKYNSESIKKTMQIHEDIFRHQVKELHRLYSVQKTLMAELKKQHKQNQVWSNSMTNSDINHSQKLIKQNYATTQTTSGYVVKFQNVSDDPSSRERSGSCSGETIRFTPRSFDLERPAMDEDQAGPSSRIPPISNKIMSTDGSDHEDSEVELTLSIGVSSSSKKRSNYRELDSSASFKSDRGDQDFSSPNTPMSRSSPATFDQEKKMPHWLLGLSINRS